MPLGREVVVDLPFEPVEDRRLFLSAAGINRFLAGFFEQFQHPILLPVGQVRHNLAVGIVGHLDFVVGHLVFDPLDFLAEACPGPVEGSLSIFPIRASTRSDITAYVELHISRSMCS